MEFWGVEVKAGQPLKVKPDEDAIIHLSQAALGESKKDKGNEPVPLFVKFDERKLVLGTLSSENIPQLSFDLVFEKEFELSHNWKNGSVFFCGYKAPVPDENFSDYGDSEDEDLPLTNADNGKIEPKVENAKAATGKATAGKSESSAKPKVNLVEPSKAKVEDGSNEDDDSDEDDYDEGSESDDSDEEGMSLDDDDEDDESEDEETPKKAEQGKKRPKESAIKTPVPSKKAKPATPQKTDGKKGGHTATPHPLKNAAKASKPQTPKSGGQFSCKSCDRTFGSDGALQSHTKAKHEGK